MADSVELDLRRYESEQARDRDAEDYARARKANLLDRDIPIAVQDRMRADAKATIDGIMQQLAPDIPPDEIDRMLHRQRLQEAGAWIERRYGGAK